MRSILRFAVSIWYHLFAVNNIFINIFSSKLILCKFSCSFLDLPDEEKPSGRVVNPLASLFTCKILLFFSFSVKTYGMSGIFASQTKSIFWQSWKGKKSQRCFVLLFHVHSLYFFFLARLSGYEDCFHRLQSLSMTGIGHLIRKETDLLSILAHTRDVFLLRLRVKNLMIIEKIKYRVVLFLHPHTRLHDEISKKQKKSVLSPEKKKIVSLLTSLKHYPSTRLKKKS